jgi:hypothetical protein
MHACARTALVSMVVAAGLGLAGCTLIDELKDTVSKMASQDGHKGEGDVPDATRFGILATKTPREEAKKASTQKRPPAGKLQEPHTVKQPSSVPAEPVTPQESAAQSPPSRSAQSQLPTAWPEAPSTGRFSR